MTESDISDSGDGIRPPSKLAALMRLLDDDSPVVRQAVTTELQRYGARLAEDIQLLPFQPDPAGWALLHRITADFYGQRLRDMWPHWLQPVEDLARLEAAFALLAEFQNGPQLRPPIRAALDALAEEFQLFEAPLTPENLAHFLFREKGLQGARTEITKDHSNLAWVLENGRGLPISLACIYILVARRLELDVRACNWPHHFLARFNGPEGLMVVDCFNGGELISAETFLRMQGPSHEVAEAVLSYDVDAVTVVTRVLNNLARAYRQAGEKAHCQLMLDLLRDLEMLLHAGALDASASASSAAG